MKIDKLLVGAVLAVAIAAPTAAFPGGPDVAQPAAGPGAGTDIDEQVMAA
jgi:hypothetical protein